VNFGGSRGRENGRYRKMSMWGGNDWRSPRSTSSGKFSTAIRLSDMALP